MSAGSTWAAKTRSGEALKRRVMVTVVGEVVSLRSQLRSLVQSTPAAAEQARLLKAEAGHE